MTASEAWPSGLGTAEAQAVKEVARSYFENNAPRMRYHWFRQCGLFTGPGVVEAGCKNGTCQRLKQSGMHWTTAGADAIAALRCQQASRPEDQIWRVPRTRHQPPEQPSPLNDLITYE